VNVRDAKEGGEASKDGKIEDKCYERG